MSYKFPVPDGWAASDLQDFCTKVADGTHDSPKRTEIGKLLVTSKNIVGGTLDLSKSYRISEDDFNEVNRRSKVDVNDVLLSMIGTVGEACLVENEPDFAIKNVGLLKNDDPLKARWLYFYLRSPQAQSLIKERLRGTTQQYLPLGEIRKFPIIFPQSRVVLQGVVDVLGRLNDKIQLNHQINQTLEQMAQAIFKSWFVDFEPVKAKIAVLNAGGTDEDALLAAMQVISGKDTDQLTQMQAEQPEQYAELRAIAELFPSAMQDSELGEIPEGWEVKTVADTAEIVKGKSYKSAELAESKTALVTLKSFNRGGGYRLDGLKEYTGKYKPKQEVIAGDLIIAYTDVTQAADVIGKPAMVIGDSRYDHLVISLDVAVVRPFEDALKPFLYGLAKTDGFQHHTRSHTTGTTVLHLAKNAVPDYEFALPLRALIQAYAKQVNPLFSLIDQNIQQGRSLQALRDTLLPKLLTGELSIHQVMEETEDE